MITSYFLSTLKDNLHAYDLMCEPVLEKFGMPKVSFDILMFLANNPGYSTAQEISGIRNIRKNLVSVHVEKLVKAGLLTRGAVEGDRRKVALSCTEKAQPIIDAGREMQRQYFEKLREGIPEDRWENFVGVMEMITKNAMKMARKGDK